MVEQQLKHKQRVPASDFSEPTQNLDTEAKNKAVPDNKWINDIYTQRKLKRDFQTTIFWVILVVSGLMLCIFSFILFIPKNIIPLLEKTPFIIAPISLLAIMPGYWISLLIKGVFTEERKEEEKAEGVLSATPPYVMVKDIAKGVNNP